MLWSTAYLESRLPSPLPTKDGGNLYAVKTSGPTCLVWLIADPGISIGNEPTSSSSIRQMSSLSAAKSS